MMDATTILTCSDAKVATKLNFTEIVVETGSAPGKGHAAFYTPDPKWMDVVRQWLGH